MESGCQRPGVPLGWSCSGPAGASGRFETRLVKNSIPLHRSIPASLGCSPLQFREGRGRERSPSLGLYAVAVVAVRTASFSRISVSSIRLGCLAGKLQGFPLSLPSQYWDFKCTPLHPALWGFFHGFWGLVGCYTNISQAELSPTSSLRTKKLKQAAEDSEQLGHTQKHPTFTRHERNISLCLFPPSLPPSVPPSFPPSLSLPPLGRTASSSPP